MLRSLPPASKTIQDANTHASSQPSSKLNTMVSSTKESGAKLNLTYQQKVLIDENDKPYLADSDPATIKFPRPFNSTLHANVETVVRRHTNH